MIEFTHHPLLQPPTDEEIIKLTETKEGSEELLRWHKSHEEAIVSATNEPLKHGFDLNGWNRIKWGMSNYNEVLALGGNRSGKTTGCAKIVMQAVTESMDGHIVCFSQNEDTSGKVQQALSGNDAQGV